VQLGQAQVQKGLDWHGMLAHISSVMEAHMTTLGYARVSTAEQCLDLQLDALRKAGCDTIEADQGVSGSATSRPGLDKALAALKPGDTLVVWKLDRLGRSLLHLIETVNRLGARGIAFKSICESIDTTTPSGRFFFHTMAALAEFERDMIRQRVNAGLESAKARGQKLGRRASLTPQQAAHAKELIEQGKTQRDVARLFRTSHTSIQRALSR
jgi:DNA invertase Pin-like site-specific DNA recombinase